MPRFLPRNVAEGQNQCIVMRSETRIFWILNLLGNRSWPLEVTRWLMWNECGRGHTTSRIILTENIHINSRIYWIWPHTTITILEMFSLRPLATERPLHIPTITQQKTSKKQCFACWEGYIIFRKWIASFGTKKETSPGLNFPDPKAPSQKKIKPGHTSFWNGRALALARVTRISLGQSWSNRCDWS